MRKKAIQFIFASGIFILLLSEMMGMGFPTNDNHNEEHHHLNEIGISTGIVWMKPENETAPGLHLHFMRRLGDEGIQKYFGAGFGLEIIFSDHQHYNIMATVGLFPMKNWIITFSPGLLFVREEGETHRHFSFHVETMYEIELGSFEGGPAFGFSVAGGDTHITLGVHIGKGF
jgi:hypothetical protein